MTTTAIDAIDVISSEQSMKRKNNAETIYSIEDIMARMQIQDNKYNSIETKFSQVIVENQKLNSELETLKKHMACIEVDKEKEVIDIKKSINEIKVPPPAKKKPGPKKDNLTVYNLFRQIILHPMVNEQAENGNLVGNKRDAVNKLVKELWSAPKVEFETKRRTDQPKLTKAELQIEYNELMQEKYKLFQQKND
jgi:regulator of replication initiation timing